MERISCFCALNPGMFFWLMTKIKASFQQNIMLGTLLLLQGYNAGLKALVHFVLKALYSLADVSAINKLDCFSGCFEVV